MSGIHYGMRYYNPGLGRWISRDPIEERGFKQLAKHRILKSPRDLNLYAFVQNSSINESDVFGLGLLKWIKCFRQMSKWEKKCKASIPTHKQCMDLTDIGDVIDCLQKRNKEIAKCMSDSKKMFKACMKACVPGKWGPI